MAFISNFCSINSLGLKVSSQSPILFLQQKPKTKKNFFMKLSCSKEKTIREQINKIIYKNRDLGFFWLLFAQPIKVSDTIELSLCRSTYVYTRWFIKPGIKQTENERLLVAISFPPIFCLNTGKHIFVEVLFQSQAALGIFKMAIFLWDNHWRFWTFSML